jgi:hypothetical protein
VGGRVVGRVGSTQKDCASTLKRACLRALDWVRRAGGSCGSLRGSSDPREHGGGLRGGTGLRCQRPERRRPTRGALAAVLTWCGTSGGRSWWVR